MKSFLQLCLVLVCLGLCSVCVWQWVREAHYRSRIQVLVEELQEENKKRVAAEKQVKEYEREIERLNALRTEIEAKLLVTTEELRDRTRDQMARGFSLAVIMNEALRAQGASRAYQDAAGQGLAAVSQRNEEVKAQNAAIEKANAALKTLAQERESLAEKLNQRTREFNELVEKYNKLVK